MKKFVAGMLSFCMIAAVAAGCSTNESEEGAGGSAGTGSTVINLWTFTDEVPKMVDKFMETHPDFAAQYTVESTIIPTTEGAYQPALDQALMNGGADAPDFYTAEEAFVVKYTQGEMSQYAAPYADLGIDVDAELAAAQIAQYTVDIGTNPNGQLVGLGYQATGGAFIYRRSIANQVFGSDDPDTIAGVIGAGTNSWDSFYDAAATLADNNVAIVSSIGDVWNVVKHAPNTSAWIVNGQLNIDPNRESFLDLAKDLIDNNWCNDTSAWQDAWFADMAGTGARPAFGFFGPAWLINYTLAQNCGSYDEDGNLAGDFSTGVGTYGDWACCPSPVGFYWGGTWLMANASSEKKEAVGQIIEWITLDCSETGLQYLWANGLMNEAGTGDCVASNTVMAISDGSTAFLGGQNMFDVFVPANDYASGEGVTQLDETINSEWQNQVSYYAHGEKTRDAAIADFQTYVAENLTLS